MMSHYTINLHLLNHSCERVYVDSWEAETLENLVRTCFSTFLNVYTFVFELSVFLIYLFFHFVCLLSYWYKEIHYKNANTNALYTIYVANHLPQDMICLLILFIEYFRLSWINRERRLWRSRNISIFMSEKDLTWNFGPSTHCLMLWKLPKSLGASISFR